MQSVSYIPLIERITDIVKYYGKNDRELYDILRSEFYNSGLKFRVNGNIILISTFRKFIDKAMDDDARLCANGLILAIQPENNDVCAICVPSPSFNDRFSKQVLINTLHQYDTCPVIDGTMMNLYFYKGEWKLGTRNLLDCRDKWWRGATYGEELDRIVAKYEHFSYDKLDKDCTYSIIMKSSRMHPTNLDDSVYLQCITNNKYDLRKKGPPNPGLPSIPLHNRSQREMEEYFEKGGGGSLGTMFIRKNKMGDGYDRIIYLTPYYKGIQHCLYDFPREIPANKRDEITKLFCHLEFALVYYLVKDKKLLYKSCPFLRNYCKEIERYIKKFDQIILSKAFMYKDYNVQSYSMTQLLIDGFLNNNRGIRVDVDHIRTLLRDIDCIIIYFNKIYRSIYEHRRSKEIANIDSSDLSECTISNKTDGPKISKSPRICNGSLEQSSN